jgi:hypothetical protein
MAILLAKQAPNNVSRLVIGSRQQLATSWRDRNRGAGDLPIVALKRGDLSCKAIISSWVVASSGSGEAAT